MNEVSKAWNGQTKLWIVFWIYNTLFGAAINGVLEFLETGNDQTFFWMFMLIAIPWAIWATVSMWRCAFNANWKGWGYLVRGLIVICILIIIAALFMGVE